MVAYVRDALGVALAGMMLFAIPARKLACTAKMSGRTANNLPSPHLHPLCAPPSLSPNLNPAFHNVTH